MSTNIISFDFDSTISNSEHRHHMIDREKDNGPDFWNRYSLEAIHDSAGPALPLAQYLSIKREPFIIVTGRSEIAREVSMLWLHDRDIYPWAMFMCDDRHNYMPHGEWKATRLAEIQEDHDWNIVLHIDDISDVAIAIEEHPKLNFPTMLVHTIGAVRDHLG